MLQSFESTPHLGCSQLLIVKGLVELIGGQAAIEANHVEHLFLDELVGLHRMSR